LRYDYKLLDENNPVIVPLLRGMEARQRTIMRRWKPREEVWLRRPAVRPGTL